MNQHRLVVENLKVGYGEKVIIENLNLAIPSNKISVVLGANGCGKSTFLKSVSRLLKPISGNIILDDKKIDEYSSKEFAQVLGLLPQSPIVPEGITVADLVTRGRYPYRKFMKNLTKEDYRAIEEALELMGITDLADRCVEELSGGQRQRVWIALSLAQDTDILLLDEPTTFLDIAYQVDILDLLTELNQKKGTTVVMILHDVNLSARYADYIFAMNNGKLIKEGLPKEVITPALMREVYGLECIVAEDPLSGAPYVIPKSRLEN